MEKDDIIAFMAKAFLFIAAIMAILIILSSPYNSSSGGAKANDRDNIDICELPPQHN